jgi:hypothetical protein
LEEFLRPMGITRYDLELEKDRLGSRLVEEVQPVRAAG